MTIAYASKQLRLLFLGSDRFSLPTLKRLLNESYLQIEVATKPSTLIDSWAKQQNVNVKYWPIDRKKYDIGLVISFGHMIDADTIGMCQKGIFNVHPSILPRWRGSTPIPRAIQHGDKQTGVSIMKIKPNKFDVGEILMRRIIDLEPRETSGTLLNRLALIASDMSSEFLANPDHYIANAVPQQEEGRTYAKKFTAQCGKIDFELLDSYEIDRRVRAFSTIIDTYTNWIDGRRLILLNSQDPDIINRLELDKLTLRLYHGTIDERDLLPGLVFYHKRRRLICFKCANGTWCAFSHVAVYSKSTMTASDFNNGYLNKLSKERPIFLKTM